MIDELGNGHLRPASQWAVDAAVNARLVDGVAGTLIVKIPRKPGDPLDVAFVTGEPRLEIKF